MAADPNTIPPLLYMAYPDWPTYRASPPWLSRPDRLTVESGIARLHSSGSFTAHCVPCGELRRLRFTPVEPTAMPNWREELACERCGMISRVRFALGWIQQALRSVPAPRLYVTEQLTPAYVWLSDRYPDVVGSEYLTGRTGSGQSLVSRVADACSGLRHEDVTRLTFADGSKDAILSFEVLEHVPDYPAALREFYRVLASGGRLLLTVPFGEDSTENVVRARVAENGTIEYLMEPEYHGDPLNDAGCLAYYAFGWRLLDELRATGFSDVGVLDGWAPAAGHLGFVGAIVATRTH